MEHHEVLHPYLYEDIHRTWPMRSMPKCNLHLVDRFVLLPESFGLYACRVIPELNGDMVGFDFE